MIHLPSSTRVCVLVCFWIHTRRGGITTRPLSSYLKLRPEDWKPLMPVIGKKGYLDHRSCPFVFKREKRSMSSIKQICERSKWYHRPQSLLPASKILTFNDWTRARDKNKAVKPANQIPNGYHTTPSYWPQCSLLALKVLRVKISHQPESHTDKSRINRYLKTLPCVVLIIC